MGRGKVPTARELCLSAALVSTIVQNAVMGKAWFLPGEKRNGNEYYPSCAHPQGEPQLLKKEEQFIPSSAGSSESVPIGFQMLPWYLCFSGRKKKKSAYYT